MNDPRDPLAEDLRRTLAVGSPDAERRRRMAGAALERADEAEPDVPGARRGWFAAVALAAAMVAALFVLAPREPRRPGKAAGGSPAGAAKVEEQRAENEAFLARPRVQKAIGEAPSDAWIAVAGGDTLIVDPDWRAALQKVDAQCPTAVHRFFYRKDMAGSAHYEITFGDAPWAGTRFLSEADLSLGGSPGGGWSFEREDPSRGSDLDVPATKRATFPAYDSRPWIPVRFPAGDGTQTMFFVVSTGSNCPLIFPETWSFPRFEIPGEATVTSAMASTSWTSRRYAMPITVEKLGLDMVVQAVVGPVGEAPRLDVKTDALEHLDEAARQRAMVAGKGVLLFVHRATQEKEAREHLDSLLAAVAEHGEGHRSWRDDLLLVSEGVASSADWGENGGMLLVLWPQPGGPRRYRFGGAFELKPEIGWLFLDSFLDEELRRDAAAIDPHALRPDDIEALAVYEAGPSTSDDMPTARLDFDVTDRALIGQILDGIDLATPLDGSDQEADNTTYLYARFQDGRIGVYDVFSADSRLAARGARETCFSVSPAARKLLEEHAHR
jgi:hypothetical protein